MTMNTVVAQMRITRELVEAENALNDALLKQSQLFSTMLAARRDIEIGQFTGQEVLMRLNKAQSDLLASGGGLARVHGGLLEIGREVGHVMDDCPDDWKQIGKADDSIAA